MISASDELFQSITGLKGGGIATAFIIGLICLSFDDGLKMFNLLVVPLILILIVMIFAKLPIPSLPKKMYIGNAFSYAALNMFLGGFLIVPDGKTMRKREIALTGLFTFLFLAATIFMIYVIIQFSNNALMPVYEVAKTLNLKYAASAVIFLAVITTMAGCFTALSAIANAIVKNKWIAGSLVLFKGIITAVIGFKLIVDIGYPIVSIIGTVYTVGVIITIIKGNRKQVFLLDIPKSKYLPEGRHQG